MLLWRQEPLWCISQCKYAYSCGYPVWGPKPCPAVQFCHHSTINHLHHFSDQSQTLATPNSDTCNNSSVSLVFSILSSIIRKSQSPTTCSSADVGSSIGCSADTSGNDMGGGTDSACEIWGKTPGFVLLRTIIASTCVIFKMQQTSQWLSSWFKELSSYQSAPTGQF